jgi:DNA-binding MarR family transcriptional regulator
MLIVRALDNDAYMPCMRQLSPGASSHRTPGKRGGPERAKPPIPYLLTYASALVARRTDAELHQHGLTLRQFGLLVQLHLEPELTMSELARQLGVSRQALHEMVRELERIGHLRRLPGSSRRTRKLELEPSAIRLLTHANSPLLRAEADVLNGMRGEEVEALRFLLQRLLVLATDDESWLTWL